MNDSERIAELEAQVERLERDLAQSQELRRDAVAARDVQAAKLRKTREQLAHLRGRLAVRIGLKVANRSARVIGRIRKLLATPRRAMRAVRRRTAPHVQPSAAARESTACALRKRRRRR